MHLCQRVMHPVTFYSIRTSKTIQALRILQTRSYAKGTTAGIPTLGKKPAKLRTGPVMEKKILPVETDINKLVTHCAGSCIYKTGEDVKLKDDSEYPEWLFKMNLTGKHPPLEELDPNTKQYWAIVRYIDIKRTQRFQKLKKF